MVIFNRIILTIFLLIAKSIQANDLTDILNQNKVLLSPVFDNPEHFEIQIIYTQIDRDESNLPHFKTFKFNVDAQKYFYPASTVKLAAAVLALEKINRLHISDLNRFSTMRIDSAYPRQTSVAIDSSAKNMLPSIDHYIKKVFLVSDNDAFNRLYEFLGQKYLNERLWELGLKDVKIVHRLSRALTADQNRHTNPITFFDNKRKVYVQPMQVNKMVWQNELPNMLRGVGFMKGDSLVKQPFDFSLKNFFSLETMHNLLQRILFPQAFAADRRFDLKKEDLAVLYKYMGMRPGESRFPHYDVQHYWDSYVKFFMYGDSKAAIPKQLRIFNKVGQAYGYLIDNAYIADFENGVEFMLSAVIHTNENRIFNDGVYEYDELGFPFLARLGRLIYNFEFSRSKAFKPDLSKFRLHFSD